LEATLTLSIFLIIHIHFKDFSNKKKIRSIEPLLLQ